MLAIVASPPPPPPAHSSGATHTYHSSPSLAWLAHPSASSYNGPCPLLRESRAQERPWTLDEDQKLTSYITQHGHGSWRALPKKAGLLRCGKSCRLRWTNYLRPDIKRGEFSPSEEQTIIQLHALLGNKWSAIATHLPKRTDNEIKNYWNTHLKKRLLKMGLDPVTHKPQSQNTTSNTSVLESKNSGNGSSAMTHMAQWESVRLEAEARLSKEAAMRAKGVWPPPPSAASNNSSLSSSVSNLQLPSMQSINSTFVAVPKLGHCGLIMHSKQENGSNGVSKSGELINAFVNWENSLQGQAGEMWPESWKLSRTLSRSTGERQESSSCSSPLLHDLNHGSPTSTLCASHDKLSRHHLSFGGSSSYTSAQAARKLSWNDVPFLHVSHDQARWWCTQSITPLPFIALDEDDNGIHLSNSKSARDGSLSFSGLQELMQPEKEDSLLIGSSLGMASVGNSSDFLGDLELETEDISSSSGHSSPRVKGRESCDIRHISFSALMVDEEYPDSEWESVLKADELGSP